MDTILMLTMHTEEESRSTEGPYLVVHNNLLPSHKGGHDGKVTVNVVSPVQQSIDQAKDEVKRNMQGIKRKRADKTVSPTRKRRRKQIKKVKKFSKKKVKKSSKERVSSNTIE